MTHETRHTEFPLNRARAYALGLCLAGLTGAPCMARQAPPSGEPDAAEAAAAKAERAKPGNDKILQCRDFLRKAEAEHPGNTVEVAEALDAPVSSQIDAASVDQAAGKSTHPWYWAGFVGSGGWE